MARKLKQVGAFIEEYNSKTEQSLPCGPIYMDSEFENHVWKEHPKVAKYLLESFPAVLEQPDYVGKHPGISNSVELVKKLDRNIVVGVKQSEPNEGGYLHLSTIHLTKDGQIKNRLKEGRLHKLP